MVRQILEALMLRVSGADPGPVRPNQLRRQDISAERRRLETSRVQTPAAAPRARTRERTESSLNSTEEQRQLRQLLSSRTGLRQVILAQEVLGPPLAMREGDPSWRRW